MINRIFGLFVLGVLSNFIVVAQIDYRFLQHGSGFAVSSKGYIMTNYHVINDESSGKAADYFRVFQVQNGETYGFDAKLVAKDPANDLAILKIIDSAFKELPELPYKLVTNSADKGSDVFTIGFPRYDIQGISSKVTKGIVIAQNGLKGEVGHYSISSAIDHGSSGGPLFDSDGNIIGITDGGLSTEESKKMGSDALSTSQYYAIKASRILPMLDNLPVIKFPEQNVIQNLTFTQKVKKLEYFVFLVAAYKDSRMSYSSTNRTKANQNTTNSNSKSQPLYQIGQAVYHKSVNKKIECVVLGIEKNLRGYSYVVSYTDNKGYPRTTTIAQRYLNPL